MSWSTPSVPVAGPAPAPPPEQDARPAAATRTRYVVQSVGQEALLCSAAETVWRVQVREASNPGGRSVVLRVAQPPEAPAPYASGASLDIDPRLVDQE